MAQSRRGAYARERRGGLRKVSRRSSLKNVARRDRTRPAACPELEAGRARSLLTDRHVRKADQSGRVLEDEVGWNLLQHDGESSLAFEALPEGGSRKGILEAKEDATSNIDAAERTY